MHGGVRYLEKAVFNLDYGQLKLVFEALHERKRMLDNAPHLCSALPIMTVGTDTALVVQKPLQLEVFLAGPHSGSMHCCKPPKVAEGCLMRSERAILLASVGDYVVHLSWLVPVGIHAIQLLKMASDWDMLLRSRATSGGRSPTTGQA